MACLWANQNWHISEFFRETLCYHTIQRCALQSCKHETCILEKRHCFQLDGKKTFLIDTVGTIVLCRVHCLVHTTTINPGLQLQSCLSFSAVGTNFSWACRNKPGCSNKYPLMPCYCFWDPMPCEIPICWAPSWNFAALRHGSVFLFLCHMYNKKESNIAETLAILTPKYYHFMPFIVM